MSIFAKQKDKQKVTLPKNHIIAKHLAIPTGGLLLLLHLFISLSYTFFLHIHTLDNGKKVLHSHPFTASDAEGDPMHQHPGSVYQLLPDLNDYLDVPEHGQTFTLNTAAFFGQMPVIYDLHFKKCPQFLRGPPALG
ncbi:hypothetical protein [Geofilum rubicundum]|uniref:Uncharacterized protein n=1 Tax=Geofilum rubicundum JCM 15548 TaxID=1236989 RepID=A0A0E9LZ88_9BACT|nr:hypothetical protein [Geofilum rubicundum]GAO30877.1 hypothetical protein JCM15548_13195 [Geofilum rubicundum JCM 15548]